MAHLGAFVNGIGTGLRYRVLRFRAMHGRRNAAGRLSIDGIRINYVDRMVCYIEYKDIFRNRIYDFETANPNPVVIDGGGYIGLATLYVKRKYPGARVLCFEPDPALCTVIRKNLAENNLSDVELVQAALSNTAGEAHFASDGLDGGKISAESGGQLVRTVRLSEYIQGPVDFLKLNIEGEEEGVLRDLFDSRALHAVDQMVVEYHGWPKRDQHLGRILEMLAQSGFRYVIHDFDAITCATSKPPFRIDEDLAWYCLVFAKRLER